MYARLAGASCSEPFAFLLIFIFTFRHIYCILLLLLFSFEIYLKFLGDLFVWSKIVFLFFPISLFIYSGFQFFFFILHFVLDREAKEIKLKKTPTNSKDVLFFFFKRKISCLRKTHIPHVKLLERKKKRLTFFFFSFFNSFSTKWNLPWLHLSFCLGSSSVCRHDSTAPRTVRDPRPISQHIGMPKSHKLSKTNLFNMQYHIQNATKI